MIFLFSARTTSDGLVMLCKMLQKQRNAEGERREDQL